MSDELIALLDKYQELTLQALEKAKNAERLDARAAIVLDMAERYAQDAQHFRSKGDLPRALAAFSYAHGWLDAGARSKFFIVYDDRLFTVDSEEKN